MFKYNWCLKKKKKSLKKKKQTKKQSPQKLVMIDHESLENP